MPAHTPASARPAGAPPWRRGWPVCVTPGRWARGCTFRPRRRPCGLGLGFLHAHPPGAGLLRKFGSTPAGRGGEGCRQARGSRQPGGTVCVSPLPPKRSSDRLAPPGRNQSSFPGPRGNFIYLPPNPWPHPHSGCRFWVSSLLKSLSFLQKSNQDSVER